MYIAGFHIDGFGIFTNAGCDNLSPGLSIFYGQNEAGKSTCLDFFRTMLTGYSEKNSRQKRSYEPLNGGHPGGSLLLHCEEKPYEIRLSRSPAAYGGLRLHAADGSALHGDVLARLLGGIDGELYRRVFGFSLEELEQWDKKSDASIRNALYGASFGPGLLSPGQASEELAKRMARIFRSRGNQQPLSAALLELERLKGEIQRWQSESTSFDALSLELVETHDRLAELAARRNELEQERRDLERRLGQWQNWDQWRSIGAKIARLDPVPDTFPEDAPGRLAALRAATASVNSSLLAAQAKLSQLDARADAVKVDPGLTSSLPELRRLSERKSSYRQADSQLKGLEESLQTARDDLAASLCQLGPGWNCDRIRQTDRSLFAREGMEKQAEALREARLCHQTASASLATANNSVESAESGIRGIEAELAGLPTPVAVLSDGEVDELRNLKARLEESRRMAPARQRTLDNAAQAFQRSLQQAQVFGNESRDEKISGILDNLISHQDEATALANEMQALLAESQEAQKKVAQAEAEAEELKGRIEEMRQAQRLAGGHTREALEEKTTSLRSLRSLAAKIEGEAEKQKELEARIQLERVPPQLRNWALIVFALLFLAGAIAIFTAHWFWGVEELRITEGAVLPINLWAAYAALLCGVVLFAAGFSAHGPEQRRHKQEFALLLSRGEQCSMQLAELSDQARRLCQIAGIDNMDPIALDAMEMLLEREKEQLFHEERSKQEIEKLKQQLAQMQAGINALQAAAQRSDMEVQHQRKRWHGLMQSLNVISVPSPESMTTVFARIEAARLAEENMNNAAAELDALWADLHQIEQAITSMPAISERLAAAPEPLSLEEAVQQALESCREAQLIWDKRNRLETSLVERRTELADAEEKQRLATDEFNATGRALDASRDKWKDCIEKLGLSGELDPETVREAYSCMQTCLGMEERVKRTGRELDQAQAEIQAMEQPLQKVLSELGRDPQLSANGAPDWLATLERLLSDAEANARGVEKLELIHADQQTQKEEIEALIKARDAAADAEMAFLALGGTSNPDEFLRLSHQRSERRNLRDRQEDLEIILEQAAQGENLKEFLGSFSDDDKERSETRLVQIQSELEKLGEEDREQTGRAAVLAERTDQIAHSGEGAALRQKEELLRETISREAREWSKLAIAEALLREAKQIYEKERQPEIIRIASEIFAKITDNRWSGMSLNLEDSSLAILPPHGEPVSPINLSRGAQEQAYLALRLAYIRSHREKAEALPLIMDEVLVNFDPERARRTAMAFADMTGSGQQQILYFTCQPHIVELLQSTFENTGLYRLENGKIEAA